MSDSSVGPAHDLAELLIEVRAVLSPHVHPSQAGEDVTTKSLASMVVQRAIAAEAALASVCGLKTSEGYPPMGDMIHALVWAVGDNLPSEVRMLLKIISLHEKTITDLKNRVTDAEALAEERRKKITMWANTWLQELLDRCSEDEEFFNDIRPSLQKVYNAILSKRKGTML